MMDTPEIGANKFASTSDAVFCSSRALLGNFFVFCLILFSVIYECGN